MRSRCLLMVMTMMMAFGCNPKDVTSPQPITITYELVSAANTGAQFNITYTSSSGPKTTVATHGWRQATTVETKPFNASVTASINTGVAFPFTLRILYNGVPRKENSGTTVAGAVTTLSVSETFN